MAIVVEVGRHRPRLLLRSTACINGETFRAIAEDLNDRRVLTAQGGKAWHPASVRKVVMTYGE